MFGFTENYVKVKTLYHENLINTIHKVTLTKIDEDGHVLFE
jgi:threonylcarbamoyladenosine tRNA methylthiotransferase MtaB